MILGAELGLLVFGIIAMARRKFSMGKRGNVTGWRAVVLGAMCAAILPGLLVVGFIVGFALALQGVEVTPYSLVWVDVLGLILGFFSTTILGRIFLTHQANEGKMPNGVSSENLQVPTFDSSNPYAPTQMTPKSQL